MMGTTHAFVGLTMAAAVAAVAPEVAVPAAVGGLAGGVFPDFDMIATHRRTLHFPVYYWIPAVPAAAVALLSPTPLTVGVALFLLAAAVHSASDVLGGGLELRPWRGTAEKGVYVHPTRRWVRPRQWIRYDGAPEDLVLAALLSVPGLLTFGGRIRTAVLAALAVSVAYTVTRKWLVEVVPERFL
ncbi:MAG: hypothetical protein ACI9YT_001942 [Halobacteriales archaeon]|jgi:hypothetical protein